VNWTLDQQTDTDDGVIRWRTFGSGGDPIVLVHGTPYSSFLWRDIAPALAQTRTVFVFDHLGYGESDKREGQDLTLAAQAIRAPARRVETDGSERGRQRHRRGDRAPGAAARRSAVLGSDVIRLRQRRIVGAGPVRPDPPAPEVFAPLPAYAHQALVTSHLRNGTHAGYRPGVLETYLRPWLGPEGQAAFYRQYRQLSEADTVDYEPHLAAVDVPVRLLWGREDRILPTPHGEWLRDHIPHESMHWIENAGHLLQEDSPAQLLSSIRG